MHAALQREASVAALAHIFPPDEYPYPDDAVRERWRSMRGRVLVAERGGVPVGVAAIEEQWLNGLYVVPSEWGSGVAATLLAAAVGAIRGAHDEAKLWCLEENRRARRFYEQNGWKQNGETRVVEYPPHPLDVGYSLALAPSASSAASWSATR
jgi:GNAT superfamily N-acetyltransferase